MNCKNCGAQLSGIESVCPTCGTPVVNDINAVNQMAPAPVQPEVVNQAIPEVPVQPMPEAVPVAPAPVEVAPAMPEVAPAPVMPETMPQEPAPMVQEVPAMPEMTAVQPTPVMPEAVPVAPTPVEVQPMAQGPVMMGQDPASMPNPMMQPQPMPTGPTLNTQPNQPATPKQGPSRLLIIILVGVVLIGAALLFSMLTGGEEESSSSSSSSENNASEVSTNTNTETYGGYTFVIPDGYRTEVDTDYGLMIGNSSFVFSVLVDYTNSYDKYKEAMIKAYPDQANDIIATVDGREYLAVILKDTDGKMATTYISKASNNATFVGMAARSDFTASTQAEFSIITKVLDSAKQSSSSFAPGDDEDAGKDGIKNFTFSKDKFNFE